MLLRLNTRKPIFATIDDEDFDLVKQYRWYRGGGRQDRKYVVSKDADGRQINLHRLVMGNPKGIVDHKDHDVLNCSKSNLRVCSFAENIRNSRKMMKRDGFSEHKGIIYNREVCRWRAKIFSHGKTIELGYFERESEAALAYNEAAIKHHGEFACLNRVDIINRPENMVKRMIDLIYSRP